MVQTALIGGIAFGLVQSIRLGLPYRQILQYRQWADILSYSGLANGALWTVCGVVLAGLWALATLMSRRMPRLAAVGVLVLGLAGAAAGAFAYNPDTFKVAARVAIGLFKPWAGIMAGYLVLSMVLGVVLIRRPTTRAGRTARMLPRLAFGVAIVLVLIGGIIQWTERPRLMDPTTRWRGSSAAMPRRDDARPNIILIVLDTQRLDRLGCYGYDRPTTPRLDAFADDAVVYENCLSTSIWTLPSHASMFTGLLVCEHGASYDHMWLDDRFTTMAESLGRVGYETVAFSNNDWIGTFGNLAQGFEQTIRPTSLNDVRGNSVYELLDKALYPAGCIGTWLGTLTAQDDGAKYTNPLVDRWLETRDRAKPFFLFINYYEPHSPYRPHPPHRKLFVSPQDMDASYRHGRMWAQVFEFALLKRDCYTAHDLKLVNDVYDGEARMLDDYVGELLEILGSRIRLDDALVMITSDHGEYLGDHHLMLHHWGVYDTLAHIPLIVRYPKRLQPGRNRDLVQTIDLLPTVMDAVCGRPIPSASTFGRSLLSPAIATTASAPSSSPTTAPGGRSAIVELVASSHYGVDSAREIDPSFDAKPFSGALRAIRRGPWKYSVTGSGHEELYHVVEDPCEVTNVVRQRPQVAREMAAELRRVLARAKRYERPDGAASPPPMTPQMQQRLRDLGYIH